MHFASILPLVWQMMLPSMLKSLQSFCTTKTPALNWPTFIWTILVPHVLLKLLRIRICLWLLEVRFPKRNSTQKSVFLPRKWKKIVFAHSSKLVAQQQMQHAAVMASFQAMMGAQMPFWLYGNASIIAINSGPILYLWWYYHFRADGWDVDAGHAYILTVGLAHPDFYRIMAMHNAQNNWNAGGSFSAEFAPSALRERSCFGNRDWILGSKACDTSFNHC